MAMIRISPELFREKGQKMQEYADGLQSVMWLVRDIVEETSRDWQSDGADAYQMEIERLIPYCMKLVECLHDYSDMIIQTAEDFEAQESCLASLIVSDLFR